MGVREDAARLLLLLHSQQKELDSKPENAGATRAAVFETRAFAEALEFVPKRMNAAITLLLEQAYVSKASGTGGAPYIVRGLGITPRGEAEVERMQLDESKSKSTPEDTVQAMPGIQIFISHSSKDAQIAACLLEYIEAGLEVEDKAIRCTSVAGYKLEVGDVTPQVLRGNLRQCSAVIAIITEASLASSYVLMELGAAWMAEKRAIPLLGPGATFDNLPGFFRDIHAVALTDEPAMADLIGTLARVTGVKQRDNQSKRTAKLKELASLAAVTKGQQPTIPQRPEDPDAELPEPIRHAVRTLRRIQLREELIGAGDDFGASPVRGTVSDLKVDVDGNRAILMLNFGGQARTFHLPFARLGVAARDHQDVWRVYCGANVTAHR